jgi:hypothetical protein
VQDAEGYCVFPVDRDDGDQGVDIGPELVSHKQDVVVHALVEYFDVEHIEINDRDGGMKTLQIVAEEVHIAQIATPDDHKRFPVEVLDGERRTRGERVLSRNSATERVSS